MRLGLHARLVMGFLAAILTIGLVSSFVGAWMIVRVVTNQAQDSARHDLSAARLVYRGALGEVRNSVRLNAANPVIHEALERGRLTPVSRELAAVRARESLDILDVTDPQGRVLLRVQSPKAEGDDLAEDPVIRAVIAGREVMAATTIAGHRALEREDPELARQARIPILPVSGTPPKVAPDLESGMLLSAAAAIVADDGRRLGILYGARLLNRDTGIVDEIKRTAYQGETYREQEVGEGTICLGDIRIATNAKLGDGRPALGTRLDQAVRQRVLAEGKPFVAPATVVGERHITAYEPIRDVTGAVVGILAVGIPESKFTAVRADAFALFFGITLGGVLLSLAITGFMARKIMHPIRGLVDGVRGLGAGNLGRRVDPDGTIREFGELGEGFNRMAAAIQERDLQLKYRTQERVGKAERLALVGRLAAGVAHELNNPLGGIMLFSNLLLRKTAADAPQRENLERIAGEAARCQRIVQGLLDFSRQRELKPELLDVAELMDKTLQLVEHQAMFHDVQVIRRYAPEAPPVRVDASQLQQVFINLILNAVEAMEGKGKLSLATQPTEQGEALQISVGDTGCGIPAENLDRLFEPFFTTKEVGRGTGLGLSISRGIVENHGGTIWVTSQVGRGTTFFIRLPVAERPS